MMHSGGIRGLRSCTCVRSTTDGRRQDLGILEELTLSWRALTRKTIEQRLAAVLRRVGCFVAIGRPGEELPELGAARMYVRDEDWQAVVLDLMAKSRLILLQVGETAGLRWEMVQIGKCMEAGQVLIFLPFHPIRDRRWSRRVIAYRAARDAIERCLPAELPKSIGAACFLYFTPATDGPTSLPWTAHPLVRGGAIPADHPLRPVLLRLAREFAFRRPRPLGGIGILTIGFIKLGALFLLALAILGC
jgi:hypothetical protein